MDFAVTSGGRTASYWFAAALDLHPDISCGHSKQNPPIPDYRGEGSGKTLNQTIIEQDELPTEPGAYYKFMRKFSDAPVLGTVHAFGAARAKDLEAAGIRIAHMTRHPVARLSSMADRSAIEAESSAAVAERLENGVRANLGRLPLTEVPHATGPDWFAFVAACFDVANEARQLEKFPHIIPSERLTGEPDYFARAVRQLADVQITADYLEQVFAIGRLNTLSGLRTTAYSIFEQWPDWKRDIFHNLVNVAPVANFEKYGYDISGLVGSKRQSSIEEAVLQRVSEDHMLIANCGVLDPKEILPDTTIKAFVPADGDFVSVTLSGEGGTHRNDTDLLHTSLPSDRVATRIAFTAPQPGQYELTVVSGDRTFKRKLTVSGQPYRLGDHGLLRAEISALG